MNQRNDTGVLGSKASQELWRWYCPFQFSNAHLSGLVGLLQSSEALVLKDTDTQLSGSGIFSLCFLIFSKTALRVKHMDFAECCALIPHFYQLFGFEQQLGIRRVSSTALQELHLQPKPQKKESLLGTGSSSQAALLPANHFGSRLSFQHPATEDAADGSATDALDPPSSSHLRAVSRNSCKDLQWLRRRATCALVRFLGHNWKASSHSENFCLRRKCSVEAGFF